MVKNFKNLRIGQVGGHQAPFYSVIWNEGELLETFGAKIIPINFTRVEQRMNAASELYPQKKSAE